jgi:roadblock/LC7 domain-containing protein
MATFNFRRIFEGLGLVPKATSTVSTKGEMDVTTADGKLNYHNGTTASPVVTEAHASTLTNKTINVDNNTVSNIEVDNLKAGVLDTDMTAVSASDDTIPSAKAAKSYIDTQDTAITTALNNHISDAVDAHDASAISVSPSGDLASTDVQSALVELQGDIDTSEAALAAHLGDAVDAHDASAISVTPSGDLAATDVQAALVELQGDIDTIEASVSADSTALANHLADATDAHDASAISVVPSGDLS